MFDAADLAAFVDPDMPGYVSATINGLPVGGLFSAAYGEAFGFVAGNKPALRVLDSVPATENDAVVCSFGNYTVATIEKSSGPQGFKVLMLEAA